MPETRQRQTMTTMVNVRIEHLPADTLGLSELSRDALSKGMSFAHLPVARQVQDIPLPEDRFDRGERAHLARSLRTGLECVDVPAEVDASLVALEQLGTCAVISGQQPGLLAAPMYTLYKAIQTCRLASELSRQYGSPVIPLFWNHADDHDVAEVHHSWLLNNNLDLQKVSLASLSSGRQPLSRLPLSNERHRLAAIENSLLQLYGDRPHKQEATELYMPREGETLPRAMTRILTELLGPYGLVVIEPDWIRADLSHAMGKIVSANPAPLLERAEEELKQAGHPVAIETKQAALVYRVDETGRHALRQGGEGFQYDNEPGSRTAAELAAEIVRDPASFSAGALLRPLVQDMSLPIAATIGGYGELAYHAQMGPLRDACGLPRTPFVPRIGCTVIDDMTQQSLQSLEVDAHTVLQERGKFTNEAEPDSLPLVFDHMRAASERYAQELLTLRGALTELDPGLAVNLKRSADQAKATIEKLAAKGARIYANSTGKGMRHVRRVNGTLYPRGLPQDRVIGPVAHHAAYGRAFVDALVKELPATGSEHLLVHIDTTGSSEPI
ncbi:MAG: bacillithiol biosynthesis cysteine-adding enzyme BshC [Planctomycetota bacterium]